MMQMKKGRMGSVKRRILRDPETCDEINSGGSDVEAYEHLFNRFEIDLDLALARVNTV